MCSCVCPFGRDLDARMGSSSVCWASRSSVRLWGRCHHWYGHLCVLGCYDASPRTPRGSRIAFEKAKATPWVDVAETPQASPFLEVDGKQFHQPGPSLVSPHSLLVRALTGLTLVVRWSSSDDVFHCVSERTGVPLHSLFYLTLVENCLTEEALQAMDRSSPIPLVMHGRLRGGSSSVPGD